MMLQPTKRKKRSGRVVTVRPEARPGRITTKIVTKKLRSGELKRYRYYQLVQVKRKGKKVTSKYLQYLGKLPPGVAANRGDDEAFRDWEADWFFRIHPEKKPTWAVCARCGQRFIQIWFERQRGLQLCPKCR